MFDKVIFACKHKQIVMKADIWFAHSDAFRLNWTYFSSLYLHTPLVTTHLACFPKRKSAAGVMPAMAQT
jgi:hypothetical protein